MWGPPIATSNESKRKMKLARALWRLINLSRKPNSNIGISLDWKQVFLRAAGFISRACEQITLSGPLPRPPLYEEYLLGIKLVWKFERRHFLLLFTPFNTLWGGHLFRVGLVKLTKVKLTCVWYLVPCSANIAFSCTKLTVANVSTAETVTEK